MSEFDFDEIDKAVTSAMGGTTETATAVVPPIVNAPPEPAPTAPATTAQEAFSIPVNKPVPPALRRSTGRIMDVMPRTGAKPAVAAQANVQKAVINAPAAVEEKPSDVDLAPTPFLPNANEKIEKRPLGSATDAIPTANTEVSSTPQLDAAPELGSIDEPIGQDTPVPAELSQDVLSVEASAETPETSAEEPASAEAAVEPEPAPEPIAEQPVPDVAPSIVQQYQEKQSSSAEQPGAIYDTQDYHKPLKEQTKKSPVVFIILWVIGLIVVGAAAGWAVYTFVLPHL